MSKLGIRRAGLEEKRRESQKDKIPEEMFGDRRANALVFEKIINSKEAEESYKKY